MTGTRVGQLALVVPRDDAAARQACDWADDLVARWPSHAVASRVDDRSPANRQTIQLLLASKADLTLYFGHGNTRAWLTLGRVTMGVAAVAAGAGTAVVSVACETGQRLGPQAVTAGVIAWLGFTIRVPVMPTHKGLDPIGDALVDGLEVLGKAQSMQVARDAVVSALDRTVDSFRNGSLASHPGAALGYYAAMCLRDHVVIHGNAAHVPLP
ncbi:MULTISPECIES: hypothetical protein [unclassified Dyella]|jgi:hypothetical protein|uniref:hypothetical protein n=1 Tax=unclassified Dyella TaxID=2634549 RepID=UPI003F90F248